MLKSDYSNSKIIITQIPILIGTEYTGIANYLKINAFRKYDHLYIFMNSE